MDMKKATSPRAWALIFVGMSISSTVVVGPAFGQTAESTRTIAIPMPNASSNQQDGQSNGKSVKKPASDLLRNGETLEVGEAAKLEENGFDLSVLNPADNKMWQNKSYPVSDAINRNFPKANIGVQFLTNQAATKFTSIVRVQSLENPSKYFQLALSRYSQPMMMRAALLRKLGYFVPSPQYYNNLKLKFQSEEEKKSFLDQAQQDMGVDFESRKWITSSDEKDHSVVLSSATLEEASSDYFDLNWGLAPNPDDPNQVPLVQRFSRNRAYRALIFPYALVDVPESVNRFSTRMSAVNSGYITLSYFMAQSFQSSTFSDAKWILNRLQKLTLQDYQQIVGQGNYPTEIGTLVLAKLVNRSNDTLRLFGLTPTVTDLNMNFTSASGLVANGKVTQEFAPGFPQRFNHGERTSPYQSGDLSRFLLIDGKSSVIATAVSKLNEKLQLATVADAANQYRQDSINKIIDHLRNRPNEPFYKEVTAWGGPIAGLNVNASRHVATGTYSGSTAAVQLVDNISVSAGLGMFRALDGIDKYMPMAGANVSVVRDYTHVRPILSIKEATKVQWSNLMIPKYMNKVSSVLKTAEQKNSEGITQSSLDAFLMDLRDGELFTISDSVALSAYLQASSSIDVLLGLQPFSFMNSVTLGSDASRVIVRQVAFHRVINDRFNGVHVYVRDMKNKSKGLELNANFYFNLLKARAQSTEADIQSDGFVIDYNPNIAGQADPESEAGKRFVKTRDDLRLALLPLFRDNDTELLYARFQNRKFEVKHNLKEQESKLKFLAWRFSKFKEDHLLEITYPISDKHPDLNPKDETVTLFSSKMGELKGRDLLGFFFDLFDGILTNKAKGNFTLSRAMGENPANAPIGKAYWRLINTEADLSKNTEQLSSVSMIQHVWGGWSLPRDKFFKVLDEVKKQFENTKIANYELLNKNDFINVKSLDFYRITANLSVLNHGLDKVRDLILQPDADALNPSRSKFPLERLIHKITKKPQDKIRYANDKELFEDLMGILGNGDQSAGKEFYMETCQIEQRRKHEMGMSTDNQLYHGNTYECLSRWTKKLIDLGHHFPADKAGQTRWLTQVLAILDEQIPLPQLLKYLGEENYVFLIRINGFRAGDEDGDQEYFSNTVGDPAQDYSSAGGLINLYVKKTGLMPTELDRTLGGFQ